ncbi:hypothetical protein D3C76_1136120 [compost metagenome]
MGKSQGVRTMSQRQRNAEGIIVDVSGNGIASIPGLVEVETAVQRGVVIQAEGVLQFKEILTPHVFETGDVQAGRERVAESIVGACEVGAVDSGGAIGNAEIAVAIAAVFRVARGEVTTLQCQVFHLVAGDHHAIGVSRHQVAVPRGEHRALRHQITRLQFGLGHAHLDRAAGQTIGGLPLARAADGAAMTTVDRQQRTATCAGSAVEAHRTIGKGVHAKADHTLRIA